METFLDSFSGNAEPPQLTVAECLLFPSAELVKSPAQRQNPRKLPAELSILTPCCMNPRLSEKLYDAGFLNITNVDSSTETITNMLETKGRGRPEMKWRVMNFTAMQFPKEEFDAVVDKRLDALMESKGGKIMANIYLYEVKRILKGKYICITSAGSHVLDLLLPKFRFGWEMSLHTIAQDQELNLQTFVVVAEKSDPNIVYSISLNLGACHGDQAGEVITAVEKENIIRGAYSQGRRNTQYTLEDLKLGARGNISEYEPGRRINLILGEFGLSRGKKSFIYNCVLLDAKQGSACFVHHYALYVVPQLRARDEDCTSKEGQWRIVESLKAARLLMVFLDSSNSIYSMRDIHYDLAPYMKQLAPGYVDCGHTYIRFQSASEGINDQEILHQVGLGDSHLLRAKDSFSWIEEQLPLTVSDCLLFPSAELVKSPAQRQNPGKLPAELSILVPCCMNPSLSEQLYDIGFLNITNVDCSTETITIMLETKGIGRPEMKWRVMNFTAMQFPNEEFDAVVDKRLDALMESKGGKIMANIYLYEVKRILKGKYICITSAGSHVLDLLFPKFRFGWEMSLHTIARDQEPNLQTFVVVAEKSDPNIVYSISLNLGACHDDQADEVITTVEKENNIRGAYSKGRRNIRYTLEDLKLGAKGNMSEYEPGRRINLILGEFGLSRGKKSFIYNCVLLDAKQGSGCLVHHYALYVVPQEVLFQLRARDEDCTSEEGQWRIVESLKVARLLMVFLDSSNSIYSMRDIHDDLAPYMKQLAPGYVDCGHTYSRFQVASDGIKDQEILHQYVSGFSGSVVVEDVTYLDIVMSNDAYKGRKFRRLIFKKTENLVQSEALLSTEITTEQKASSSKIEVVHRYLASKYHKAIIWGIILISSYLKISNTFLNPSKAVVLGLGAGLLPMHMKTTRHFLNIEVAELDPSVLVVAREQFGLEEDKRLKVHIIDGVKFVKKMAEDESSCKVDILVVDVNSSDTSFGLACPGQSFVEESFFSDARESLSEKGLFVMNLISKSVAVRNEVHSRLKKVFNNNIFRLKLEEDVDEVLYALKADAPIKKRQFSRALDNIFDLSRPIELLE